MNAQSREIRTRVYSKMIHSETYSTDQENAPCEITYIVDGRAITMKFEPGYGYTMEDGMTVIEDYDDAFDYVPDLFVSSILEMQKD